MREITMFNLPASMINPASFEESCATMLRFGNEDLLWGMKRLDAIFDAHCTNPLEDDDDLYYSRSTEFNAYNVVKENMSKLFV